MSADPGALAAAYLDAWLARDFETLRSLLADNVSFRGPLATIQGADDCVAGLRVAPPAPTANWSHINDGRIARIHVTFDARGLGPPGP